MYISWKSKWKITKSPFSAVLEVLLGSECIPRVSLNLSGQLVLGVVARTCDMKLRSPGSLAAVARAVVREAHTFETVCHANT